MKEMLVGTWRSIRDLDFDEPVKAQFIEEIVLNSDGTADWGFVSNKELPKDTPFPVTWELPEPSVISIWLPIEPMPEYDMPDWSREELRFDVIEVTEDKLTLSQRRYDDGPITQFERIA